MRLLPLRRPTDQPSLAVGTVRQGVCAARTGARANSAASSSMGRPNRRPGRRARAARTVPRRPRRTGRDRRARRGSSDHATRRASRYRSSDGGRSFAASRPSVIRLRRRVFWSETKCLSKLSISAPVPYLSSAQRMRSTTTAVAWISSAWAAVGLPPTCAVRSAMVALTILASRVRPSRSRTARCDENTPTRLRSG